MTFRCPIDGRELEDGKPCPDHGIAFSDTMQGRGRTVATARPLSRSSSADEAPQKRTRRTSK